MAIPNYQTIMLPLLQFVADEKERSTRAAIEHLAQHFGLTEAERTQLLPSGAQATFDNRVGWSVWHSKKAALLEATRRSHFLVTARGKKVRKKARCEYSRRAFACTFKAQGR